MQLGTTLRSRPSHRDAYLRLVAMSSGLSLVHDVVSLLGVVPGVPVGQRESSVERSPRTALLPTRGNSLVLAPDVNGVAGGEGDGEVGNLLGDTAEAPEDVARDSSTHTSLLVVGDGCLLSPRERAMSRVQESFTKSRTRAWTVADK